MTAPTFRLADDTIFNVPGIRTHLLLINAETAKRWLTRNTRNRRFRIKESERIHRDIVAGRWHFTGEAIKFDNQGTLLDGQHRLTAISWLEPADLVQVEVITGLDPSSQAYMDQVLVRSTGDQLHLREVKNSDHIAAVFRNVIVLDRDGVFRDWEAKKLSKSEVMEYTLERPDEIAFSNEIYGLIRHVEVPNRLIGAFAVHAYRKYPEQLIDFLTQLHDLVGLDAGDPVLTLNNRLRQIHQNKLNYSPMDYMALLIQAFNAYLEGRKLSRLLRPKGGWTVETFPELVSV